MAKARDDHRERYESKRRREEAHSKQLPGEDEPQLPPPGDPIRKEQRDPDRNEPCPCGSGKKYKKCCGRPK